MQCYAPENVASQTMIMTAAANRLVISYHISYVKFIVPPLHYKTMGALHSS